MSLKIKIPILFLIVTLVPLLTAMFVSYRNSEFEIRDSVKKKLEGVAEIQKRRVEELLISYIRQTNLIASNTQLKSSLKKPSTASKNEANKIFIDAKLNSARLRKISVLDTLGIVIVSTEKEDIGKDNSHDVSFLEGQKTTKILDVFKDNENVLVVRVTSPLIMDNRLIGIVEAIYRADDLVKITEDYVGLGATGEVLLVKPDTRRNVLFLTPLRFDTDATLKSTQVGDLANVPLIMAILGREATFTGDNIVDYRGKEVFATTRFIKSVGWALMAKVDKDEALSPIKRLAFNFTNIVIATFLISMVTSILTSRNIISPIIDLTNVVNTFREGNLLIKAGTNSSEEVNVLGVAFNEMAVKLREYQVTLEQRIAEKTKELESKVLDLEKTEKATLNLLQDLDMTKKFVEEEQARDEAILSNIGEGLIVVDNEGFVIKANKTATKLTGYDLSEIVGEKYVKIFNIQDESGNKINTILLPQYTHGEHKEVISQLSPVGVHYFIRKDGSKFPMVQMVTPVVILGKVLGTVSIFRDITREKEIDRMKTEFISLASHQLRTPLSAMRWFSEMLLSGDAGVLTPEQTSFVQNINDSNKRMIELINALLNISRIESGRIVIDPVPTSLFDLVDSLIKELTTRLYEKKQKLILDIDERLPKINIDPGLIREVYLNLLTNSIKYTPEGGEIKVSVHCVNVEHRFGYILSSISDTGYGIPEKERDKVFQKFYRGENILTLEAEGTGLGLYLAKAIAESSGGKLWFESIEGNGSSFWFSLPLSGSLPKKGEVRLGT